MTIILYQKTTPISLPQKNKEISSKRIQEGIFYGPQCMDAFLSLARYNRMSSYDLMKKKAAELTDTLTQNHVPDNLIRKQVDELMQKQAIIHPHQQGYMIDLACHHHFVTGLIILIALGLTGLAWLYHWYEEEHRVFIASKKYESSHTRITTKLHGLPTTTPETSREEFKVGARKEPKLDTRKKAIADKEVEQLQSALRRVLNGPHKEKFARFNTAIIKQEGNSIALDFKPFKPSFNILNCLKTIWNMLFISAFIYWLGWMTSGIFLGIFGTGFAGCLTIISFGLPALFGLVYAGVKIKHWYQHREENREATLEEMVLADKLMDECCEERDRNLQPQQQPQLPQRQPANENPLGKISSILRIGAAFLIGLTSGFSAAHYILWILSDFASVLLSLTNVLGIAALIVATLVGVVTAQGKYNDIAHTACETLSPEEQIEYVGIKNKIKDIKNRSREREGELCLLAGKIGDFLESPSYKFYDYFMSAAFIARVFAFSSTTSTFLPACFHIIATMAGLSNVAVFLFIFGVGLGWAIIRTCVRKVEEKATLKREYDLAKAELAILEERENSILRRQEEIARLKESVDELTNGKGERKIERKVMFKEKSNLVQTEPISLDKEAEIARRQKEIAELKKSVAPTSKGQKGRDIYTKATPKGSSGRNNNSYDVSYLTFFYSARRYSVPTGRSLFVVKEKRSRASSLHY